MIEKRWKYICFILTPDLRADSQNSLPCHRSTIHEENSFHKNSRSFHFFLMCTHQLYMSLIHLLVPRLLLLWAGPSSQHALSECGVWSAVVSLGSKRDQVYHRRLQYQWQLSSIYVTSVWSAKDTRHLLCEGMLILLFFICENAVSLSIFENCFMLKDEMFCANNKMIVDLKGNWFFSTFCRKVSFKNV